MFPDGIPFHPIIVHLPVALSMLMPVAAFGAAWWIGRGGVTSHLWRVVAVLQLILVGSGYAAMETGEDEEEKVERIVAERYIAEHEERAEAFVWTGAGVAALAVAAAAVREGAWRRRLRVATGLGTLAVAGLAAWTGHAGGLLVYQHNAGAAYSSPAPAADAQAPETDED